MGVKEILQELTGKKNIYLVRRGNVAIKEILSLFQDKTILLADQGGWLTYDVYSKKSMVIETDSGIINPKDLEEFGEDYTLLVNSMAAYTFPQDMEKLCKGGYEVINDATGSLGTENAKFGGYIIGSFGKAKPVNLGEGGFIATNEEIELQEDFNMSKEEKLQKLLENLTKRLTKLKKITKKVKEDLKEFNMIHPEYDGINVIVSFKDEDEKQQIIKYCENNKLEFTECPREIRVLEQAISIEVKRK